MHQQADEKKKRKNKYKFGQRAVKRLMFALCATGNAFRNKGLCDCTKTKTKRKERKLEMAKKRQHTKKNLMRAITMCERINGALKTKEFFPFRFPCSFFSSSNKCLVPSAKKKRAEPICSCYVKTLVGSINSFNKFCICIQFECA